MKKWLNEVPIIIKVRIYVKWRQRENRAKAKVVWSSHLRATLSHYTSRRNTRTAVIRLSYKVCDTLEHCQDTLLHDLYKKCGMPPLHWSIMWWNKVIVRSSVNVLESESSKIYITDIYLWNSTWYLESFFILYFLLFQIFLYTKSVDEIHSAFTYFLFVKITSTRKSTAEMQELRLAN